MATLTELLSDVYAITKRPDLITQTTLAVKAATLKAHQSDFYPKDLFETGVVFDTTAYYQSLDYRSLIPRYRALKYIRKTDVSGADGDFLTVITPEAALDSYYVNKENVVYLAGTALNIKSSTSLQYIFLGCYLNPDITDSGYSSWISIDHQFLIVFDAARAVFKGIGFDEQSAQMDKLVGEQLTELKMDSILAQGY